MSLFFRFGPAALGAVLCLGCATKSLPPGTPPPEYEKRTFEPWPPVDAGVDAADPDAGLETPVPDAGPASDGAAPPETGMQAPL